MAAAQRRPHDATTPSPGSLPARRLPGHANGGGGGAGGGGGGGGRQLERLSPGQRLEPEEADPLDDLDVENGPLLNRSGDVYIVALFHPNDSERRRSQTPGGRPRPGGWAVAQPVFFCL